MSEEMQPKTEPRTFAEELNVAGTQLLQKVQELVQQGNIRRLSILDANGRVMLEVPLTLGVVGSATVVIFAPWLAALGAIAALVTRVRIVVERYENPEDADKETAPTVVDLTPPPDRPSDEG
jgi:hypothetical protein